MPFWRLYYHIVWATKNREPLIGQSWEQSLLLNHPLPQHNHLLICTP
jgi:hypothetical protein